MTILDWAQFWVIIAAAVFLIVKFGRGWFNPNMSLSGETQRCSRGDGWDDLAIAMTVTKGGIGSVTLHRTFVSVTSLDGAVYKELQGTAGVEFKEKRGIGRRRSRYEISQPWVDKGFYKLPPGASSIWSCHAEVRTGKACTIQVVIVGRQTQDVDVTQWRASLISLPRHRS